MKQGDKFLRKIPEGCGFKIGPTYRIIAIDIYGRILMEDVDKPYKDIMIWDVKDVLDQDNFLAI